MLARSLRAIAVVAVVAGVPLGMLVAARTVLAERWLPQGLTQLAAQVVADHVLAMPGHLLLATASLALLAWVGAGGGTPLRAVGVMIVALLLAWPPVHAALEALRPIVQAYVFGHGKGLGAELYAGGLPPRAALLLLWALADVGEELVALGLLGLTGGLWLTGWIDPRRLGAIARALDRPRWAAAVGLPALLAVLAIRGNRALWPPDGPDVVVIILDTVRADRLGLYGSDRDTDPTLRALARDAVWYRHALAPAPWTSPSIASVLTGHHASRFGYRDRPVALPARVVTLPERVADAGWHTIGVVANLYASRLAGFDQGFARWDEGDARGTDHISSASLTDKALALVRSTPARRPLFLWAHYFDPHCGYADHPELSWTDVPYDGPVIDRMDYHALQALVPSMAPADLQHVIDLYDEEIRYTDGHVGRLLDGLKAAGRYDDALIVVLSDHGEAFDDRPDRHIGHAQTLYQELLHVPLLIKWPGSAHAGVVVDAPTTLYDIVPTVVEALHLEGSGPTDGVALVPAAIPQRVLMAETRYVQWLRAVVDGPLKLVHHVDADTYELYDLAADPGETVNLADVRPDAVARLSEGLRTWVRDIASDQEVIDDAVFTPDEARMLEALGYIDPDDD